jgi:hypothetical protein
LLCSGIKRKVRNGEAPLPAREARALPGIVAASDHS